MLIFGLKNWIMTLELKKYHVMEMLMNSQDEKFIEAIEQACLYYFDKKDSSELTESQKKALLEDVKQGEEDIKNGNVISMEDLEKEMESW